MQYYITRNGQQLGPFTDAEVRSQLAAGTLSPLDFVWWDGQANWIPLGESQVAATAQVATPTPAGLPAAPVVPGVPGTIQPTSQLAIWALVCGCTSLFCSVFTAIPAIILGHMGLSEIKKNPGRQGKGLALAGLILGYVFTTFGVLYIAVVGISVLIALGNQVKNKTPSLNAPSIEQSTNAPDESTSTPAASSPDQSTNAAPATPNTPSTSTPDSSTNTPSTNSSDSSTNTAPLSQ